MSNKQRALAKAAELGVTIEGKPDGLGLMCHAPEGMIWNATSAHDIVSAKIGYEYADALWKAMLDDMADGFQECGDPECDVCHPELYEQLEDIDADAPFEV